MLSSTKREFKQKSNITCKICNNIFFTADEWKQYKNACKKYCIIEGEIRKLEKEAHNSVNEVYSRCPIDILSLYGVGEFANCNVVLEHRENINNSIKEIFQLKNEKVNHLKDSVGCTSYEDELISRMCKIVKTCVINCCQDCEFGWYCQNCYFTLVDNGKVIKTCGVSLIKRLLKVNHAKGKYAHLTHFDIYLLEKRFVNELKFGICNDILRGKFVNLGELRQVNHEQKQKRQKICDEIS